MACAIMTGVRMIMSVFLDFQEGCQRDDVGVECEKEARTEINDGSTDDMMGVAGDEKDPDAESETEAGGAKGEGGSIGEVSA